MNADMGTIRAILAAQTAKLMWRPTRKRCRELSESRGRCAPSAASTISTMTNETSVAPATEPPTLPADAPLVDRLAATASARAAVISRGRKASSARRYDRGGWASLIFRVRHRGFEDIWPPLLLVLLVSAAWTPLVATGTVSDGVCDAIDTYQSAFSLLRRALAAPRLPLNQAAHRHYEARGLCGLMIAESREVGSPAIAHLARIRGRACSARSRSPTQSRSTSI